METPEANKQIPGMHAQLPTPETPSSWSIVALCAHSVPITQEHTEMGICGGPSITAIHRKSEFRQKIRSPDKCT
jgi:hypothetical protein